MYFVSPARRCASVVLHVTPCPSFSLCVCHKFVFCPNTWTDLAGFWHRSFTVFSSNSRTSKISWTLWPEIWTVKCHHVILVIAALCQLGGSCVKDVHTEGGEGYVKSGRPQTVPFLCDCLQFWHSTRPKRCLLYLWITVVAFCRPATWPRFTCFTILRTWWCTLILAFICVTRD